MTAPHLQTTRDCPFAPPAEHERLRDRGTPTKVTMPNGAEAWALSRLDDIRAMLSDPRFSSDRLHPGFPSLLDEPQPPPRQSEFRPPMIMLDPPEHGAARREVVGEFTVRRMNALRPRVQEIVDQHIGAMLAGPDPADLVRALALPVPSLVVCELLGVPYEDHDLFQTWSTTMLSLSKPHQERMAASGAIQGYIAELIVRKRENPADDLLSRQLAKTDDIAGLVSLGFLLLLAGHETTANQISLGVVALLDHPDQLAAMVADPSLTPAAVEELLRYCTIAEYATSRVAREDVELGGVLIRAGEGVVTLGNAANRDPAAFKDAGDFDLARGARHHIAFGFGPHQCLGQNLARLELEIVFNTLFRRIPALRLAVPADELRFKDDATVYGLHELPVTWTEP